MKYTTPIKNLGIVLAVGFSATLTGFSAPPASVPAIEPGTPRKAEFPITVPLIYESRQVGTSGIPAGETIRVIRETTTTMTLWYMNKEVTVLQQIAEYQGEFYSVRDAASLKARSSVAP